MPLSDIVLNTHFAFSSVLTISDRSVLDAY